MNIFGSPVIQRICQKDRSPTRCVPQVETIAAGLCKRQATGCEVYTTGKGRVMASLAFAAVSCCMWVPLGSELRMRSVRFSDCARLILIHYKLQFSPQSSVRVNRTKSPFPRRRTLRIYASCNTCN